MPASTTGNGWTTCNPTAPSTPNLRADTHRDNRIMQHILQKHGFRYCGIIYLLNGDERLAYQKISLGKPADRTSAHKV